MPLVPPEISDALSGEQVGAEGREDFVHGSWVPDSAQVCQARRGVEVVVERLEWA